MTESLTSLLPYLINGVAFGLSVSLVALALSLIWRTVGMIDFGLGAVYLAVAYTLLALKAWLGLPLWLAVAGGLVAGPAASIGLYLLIYRRLIRRNAALFVLVLVALAVLIATQNGIGAAVSAQKFYFIDDILPGWEVAGTRLNVVQAIKVGVSLAALAGVVLLCTRTEIGLCILAVADSRVLAQGIGINTEAAHIRAFGVAGLIVAASAIPEAAETGVDPYIATNPVFLGMAAIIIGGLGRFQNPVLGAVLLGLAFHLAVWAFSSQWQEVVAYSLVIATLIARPQGLFGGMKLVRDRP